jgi:hypothetical protein
VARFPPREGWGRLGATTEGRAVPILMTPCSVRAAIDRDPPRNGLRRGPTPSAGEVGRCHGAGPGVGRVRPVPRCRAGRRPVPRCRAGTRCGPVGPGPVGGREPGEELGRPGARARTRYNPL